MIGEENSLRYHSMLREIISWSKHFSEIYSRTCTVLTFSFFRLQGIELSSTLYLSSSWVFESRKGWRVLGAAAMGMQKKMWGISTAGSPMEIIGSLKALPQLLRKQAWTAHFLMFLELRNYSISHTCAADLKIYLSPLSLQKLPLNVDYRFISVIVGASVSRQHRSRQRVRDLLLLWWIRRNFRAESLKKWYIWKAILSKNCLKTFYSCKVWKFLEKPFYWGKSFHSKRYSCQQKFCWRLKDFSYIINWIYFQRNSVSHEKFIKWINFHENGLTYNYFVKHLHSCKKVLGVKQLRSVARFIEGCFKWGKNSGKWLVVVNRKANAIFATMVREDESKRCNQSDHEWFCYKKLDAITDLRCDCGNYRCCLEYDLGKNVGAIILLAWAAIVGVFVLVIGIWAAIALTRRGKMKGKGSVPGDDGLPTRRSDTFDDWFFLTEELLKVNGNNIGLFICQGWGIPS